MFNAQLSTEIFSQLMNGRIINKTILNNSGEFAPNIYFHEIMDNLKDYRVQYQMNGFELVEEPEYVYIFDRTFSRDDLKTDITMKAYMLLLILGKYLTEHNYRLSKLTEPSGGITHADIEVIQEMPDTQEILEKSGVKSNLLASIKSVLVERSILLEKPSSQSYILSDSGRAFFDEIKNYYGV